MQLNWIITSVGKDILVFVIAIFIGDNFFV